MDGAPARVVFDHRFLAGYEVGYAHGIDRGRQLADDEAQWPFEIAQQHVRALLEIEPHEARWQRAVGSPASSVQASVTPTTALPNEKAGQQAVGARTSCVDVVAVGAVDGPQRTTFHRAVSP